MNSKEDEIEKAMKEIQEMENKAKKKSIDLTKAYTTDENIKKIVSTYENEKREKLRKKLYAKLKTFSDNRSPENTDNVKYNHKGKKIGRIQKQYIEIQEGPIKKPYEIEQIRKILKGMENDPIAKKQFIEKTKLSEEACNEILANVENDNINLVENVKIIN